MRLSARTGPASGPEEAHLCARQAGEHLVGAHGVEGREAVEQRNGDLHG